MVLRQIKKDLAKNKTDKFGVRNYGNGPQFGMYAIIAAQFANDSHIRKGQTYQ